VHFGRAHFSLLAAEEPLTSKGYFLVHCLFPVYSQSKSSNRTNTCRGRVHFLAGWGAGGGRAIGRSGRPKSTPPQLLGLGKIFPYIPTGRYWMLLVAAEGSAIFRGIPVYFLLAATGRYSRKSESCIFRGNSRLFPTGCYWRKREIPFLLPFEDFLVYSNKSPTNTYRGKVYFPGGVGGGGGGAIGRSRQPKSTQAQLLRIGTVIPEYLLAATGCYWLKREAGYSC